MATITVYRNKPTRSVGSAATFVRHAKRRARERADANVPCGSCNACCRTPSMPVDLKPNEIGKYQASPHPTAQGGYAVDRSEDGSCIYLQNGKCSIYESRPLACRVFDCRIFSVCGVMPAGDGPLRDAIEQWYPEMRTVDDKDTVVALRMAAMDAGQTEPFFEMVTARAYQNVEKFMPMARYARQRADNGLT